MIWWLKNDGLCIRGSQALDIAHTINSKFITTINTDCNTELFDQELTPDELSEASGGDSDSSCLIKIVQLGILSTRLRRLPP